MKNKILVLITTYKRNGSLKKLLDQIMEYTNFYDINVCVWDDMPTNKFFYDNKRVNIIRNKENRGKKKFYLTWNEMFSYCKNNKSDFYLFLQDDNCLTDDFFGRLITIWNTLDNPISLSPLIDDTAIRNNKSRWGNKQRDKITDKSIRTHWFDCIGLVKEDFFISLDWKLVDIPSDRWNKNKNLSSGVGEQITKRLQQKNKNMYHCAPSLIILRDIDSVMNKEERMMTPLITTLKSQRKYIESINPIISLTTYPKRYVNLKYVIKSLLNQDYGNCKICLTLYRGDYDVMDNKLKKFLNDCGVDIIISDIDIKPHKKYFYAMQKYRDNPIITVDDDIIYDKSLVSKLMDSYEKNNNCVICGRCRKMLYNSEGLMDYRFWKLMSTTNYAPAYDIIPTGVGGVLYPPNILNIDDSILPLIYEFLNVDDILLKKMELENEIPCVFIGNEINWYGKDIINDETKNSALCNKNLNENENDIYIKKSDLYSLLKKIDVHGGNPNNVFNDKEFSICITAFESEKFIKETLDSIYKQPYFNSHNNFEVLIGVDGCKSTLKVLKEIGANYKNLKIFMMDSNRGTYVTTNTLMKMAKYDTIIRFDSDDIMNSNFIDTVIKEFKNCDILTYRTSNFGLHTNITDARGSIVISKSVFEKYGGYRPWKCSADYELLERLKHVCAIKHINNVIYRHRCHPNSLTCSQGDTCLNNGFVGNLRQQYNSFVRSLNVRTENDAKIECVTNTYKEITPDAPKSVKKNVVSIQQYNCNAKISCIIADTKVMSKAKSLKRFFDNEFAAKIVECPIWSYSAAYTKGIELANECDFVLFAKSNVSLDRFNQDELKYIINRIKKSTDLANVGIVSSDVRVPGYKSVSQFEGGDYRETDVVKDQLFMVRADILKNNPVTFRNCKSGTGFLEYMCKKSEEMGYSNYIDDTVAVYTYTTAESNRNSKFSSDYKVFKDNNPF